MQRLRKEFARLLDGGFRPASDCCLEGWAAAAAIVGAAVVGGVASNAAASKQASADKQAANTQAGMFNTITGNEQPYLNAGNSAETTLSQLLGTASATGAGGTAAGTNLAGGYLTQTFNPTMQSLEQTPGYQFSLQQGDQAVQNSAAASTGAVSGAALKSLSAFNQGLASTQYQNSFNNFQTQQNNIFNRLSSIASLGQNAAGNLGNSGAQLGTGIAQAQAAAGSSQAAGIVGASNSLTGSAVPLAYLMSQNSTTTPSTTGTWGTTGTTGVSGGNYDGSVDSDYALKCEIEPYRFNGMSKLMVYDFEFKDEPGIPRRGYIAQEVQERYPEAVSRGPKGFLRVDYAKLPGRDELDQIIAEDS